MILKYIKRNNVLLLAQHAVAADHRFLRFAKAGANKTSQRKKRAVLLPPLARASRREIAGAHRSGDMLSRQPLGGQLLINRIYRIRKIIDTN